MEGFEIVKISNLIENLRSDGLLLSTPLNSVSITVLEFWWNDPEVAAKRFAFGSTVLLLRGGIEVFLEPTVLAASSARVCILKSRRDIPRPLS